MQWSIDYFSHNKKPAYVLFLVIIVVASFVYLWNLNALPFTDYDEATYAQVTRDTIASGSIGTLNRFADTWFEKPPLYFWMAMGSTTLFGTEEYAYRLPSAIMAILGIAFFWLLVKRLTRNSLTAMVACLVLMISSFYYIAARQVRLDIPAITMIIASLTALIYGWKQAKFLLLIAPALAVAFLFKSFLAFFAIPALLIFSLFYKKFSWLLNKYFWIGVVLAIAIVVPWHWWQWSQWGEVFVSQYFGYHVLERFGTGIAESQIFDPIGYVQLLFMHGQPWVSVFIILFIFGIWKYIKTPKTERSPLVLASGTAVIVIFMIVSFGKTRILTYMLPIFPFISIVVGVGLITLIKISKNIIWRLAVLAIFIILLIFSARLATGANPKTLNDMHYQFNALEKDAGLFVAKDLSANFYLLDWPFHESLRYYSGKQIVQIPFPPEDNTLLIGPWYLMITNQQIPYFLEEDGSPKTQYQEIKIPYKGEGVFLFYSDQDLILIE